MILASPARILFGQVLLILVHLVFLGAAGYVIAQTLMAGTDTFPPAMRRTVLAGAFGSITLLVSLGVLMWAGFGWPRWILSLGFFVGALLMLPLLESKLHGSRPLIALGSLVLVVLSATLAFVGPIDDFIRHRERLRRLNR